MAYVDTELAVKEPEIKRIFPKEFRNLADGKFSELLEAMELR